MHLYSLGHEIITGVENLLRELPKHLQAAKTSGNRAEVAQLEDLQRVLSGLKNGTHDGHAIFQQYSPGNVVMQRPATTQTAKTPAKAKPVASTPSRTPAKPISAPVSRATVPAKATTPAKTSTRTPAQIKAEREAAMKTMVDAGNNYRGGNMARP